MTSRVFGKAKSLSQADEFLKEQLSVFRRQGKVLAEVLGNYAINQPENHPMSALGGGQFFNPGIGVRQRLRGWKASNTALDQAIGWISCKMERKQMARDKLNEIFLSRLFSFFVRLVWCWLHRGGIVGPADASRSVV